MPQILKMFEIFGMRLIEDIGKLVELVELIDLRFFLFF